MSLFRRFESAVCPPPKASRQPAGPFARLHSPSRTCLHRSLACQSRCMSLFRRFESAVCPPPMQKPLGSRQGRLPGSTALPGTFGCTCLRCLPRPVHVTLYRRFESAVCPPPKASRQPARPFARLHSPSRDLWLHMPAPQPCLPAFRKRRLPALKSLSAAGRAVCQAPQPFPGPLAAHACTAALPAKAGACHSLGVSKAPFARPKSLRQPAGPFARLHSPSRGLWLHMPAPQPCLPKPVHHSLACQSRCMSLFRRLPKPVHVTL